jgi:hypothetical protein
LYPSLTTESKLTVVLRVPFDSTRATSDLPDFAKTKSGFWVALALPAPEKDSK